MVEKGLVSVIVASYNSSHTIGVCLSSVILQTYRPIQICLHDDGSSDDSARVIKKWADAINGNNHEALRLLMNNCWGLSAISDAMLSGLGLFKHTGNIADALTMKYTASPPRCIDTLHSPRGRGPGYARQCAIQLSTGAVVSILDSDDAMLPRRIQAQLHAMGSQQHLGPERLHSLSWLGGRMPAVHPLR